MNHESVKLFGFLDNSLSKILLPLVLSLCCEDPDSGLAELWEGYSFRQIHPAAARFLKENKINLYFDQLLNHLLT